MTKEKVSKEQKTKEKRREKEQTQKHEHTTEKCFKRKPGQKTLDNGPSDMREGCEDASAHSEPHVARSTLPG